MKNYKLSQFFIMMLIFSHQLLFAQFSMGINGSSHISIARPDSRLLGRSIYAEHEFGFISEKTTPSYGISLHKSFGRLFLMNEFNYRQSEKTLLFKNFVENKRANELFTEKAVMVNLPVIAGLNVTKNFKIGGGTNFNFIISDEDKISEFDLFEKRNRKVETGFVLYASYKVFNRILLNARYENMFSDIGDNYYYNNSSTRIRTNLNYFSFGISVFPTELD